MPASYEESNAFKQEGLLESFRRRYRECDTIGDLGVRAPEADPDPKGLIVSLDNPVCGQETGRHGQPTTAGVRI